MEQGAGVHRLSGSAFAFRSDVEGLRAVAVVAVILYHARPTLLPGGFVGVDVFFVVSGFLISSLLLREFAGSGTISLTRFLARRARRLLPAATLTLVATTVAGRILLDGLSTGVLARDIAAAATFAANIRFGSIGNDYLASGLPPSPVLHFWSLAVEEQYYLVWPGLVLLVLRVGRRAGRQRVVLAATVGVLFAGSLAWSLAWTSSSVVWAFFLLPTRAWELLAGAAVAVAAPTLSRAIVPRAAPRASIWTAWVLGVVGMLMIAQAMVGFSTSTVFPGWAAVLPVVGTALVVGAGVVSPLPALSLSPLQWVGARSYSLYLWHFPFLILAERRWGPLTSTALVGVLAAAVVVAHTAHRFVEEPIRRSAHLGRRHLRSLALSLAGMTVSLIGASLLVVFPPSLVGGAAAPEVTFASATTMSSTSSSSPVTSPESTTPGVVVTSTTVSNTTTTAWIHALQADLDDPPWLAGLVVSNLPVLEAAAQATELPSNATPSLVSIREDVPVAYDDGCHVGIGGSRAVDCVYGDPDGALQMVLFGDSHLAQWLPAFDEVGRRNGWQVRLHSKRACPWTFIPTEKDQIGNHCAEWQRSVVEAISADPPDVLVVSGYRYVQVGWAASMTPDAAWERGARSALDALRPLAAQVVILGDSSTPALDVPSCLAAHRSAVDMCMATREQAVRPTRLEVERRLADEYDALFVPTSNWTCTASACPVVVGRVVMYRDDSHLTATAVGLLTPYVEALVRALR